MKLRTLMCASVAGVLALMAVGAPVYGATFNQAPTDARPAHQPSVAGVLARMALGAPVHGGIFNDGPEITDSVIEAHRERQVALLESVNVVLAKAEAEKRDLTVAEQGEINDLNAEFEDVENQVNLRTRSLANAALLNAPRARQSTPDPIEGDDAPAPRARAQAPAPQRLRVDPQPRASARGTDGFRSMGEFADKVRAAALGRQTDPRLANAAASTIGSEGVGADGGFSVPADFRAEIASKVFGEDSLVARTDRMKTSSNSITMPSDMTSPWDSTGGIQAYWGNEAGALQQSKPKLEDVTYKAHKLHVLVPMTEELLEDSPAMDSYLRRKAPEKMDFKIDEALIRGTGAGQPLGILNAPALVSVAAEGAQTADTVNQANISKMWARMPVKSRSGAIWLINPEVEAQLDGLVVGQQPVYMPAGGLADTPFGRMKGRPVIPHQVCSAIGDVGDIMLVDWNQYMTLTKLGAGRDENGMKIDVSMHLWFDQDLTAFKFTIRIGGQPWWSVPTAAAHGAATMSPFVTLAAR